MAGKNTVAAALATLLLVACGGPSPEGVVRIGVSARADSLPVCAYGIRIVPEEVPGSLSAEQVRNQWFEEGMTGWEVTGDGVRTGFTTDCPLYPDAPAALSVTVPEGGKATLRNNGYGGMDIRDKDYYYLRLNTAWGHRFDGMLSIRLAAGDGRILCDRPLRPDRDSLWCEYTGQLIAEGSAPDAVLEIGLEGTGTLLIDYVSLMPFASFHRRIYGMRVDAGEALEALQPAFVRWDGGNGWGFTEGDPKGRILFGIQELMELSEDIGSTAHLAFSGRPALRELQNAADYARGVGDTWWSHERMISQREPYPLTLLEADEPYTAEIPYGVPFTGMRTAIVPVVDALSDASVLLALEPQDTLAVPAVLFSKDAETSALIHTTPSTLVPTPSYTVWQLVCRNRPAVSLPLSGERIPESCSFSAGYDPSTEEIVLKIVNRRTDAAAFSFSLDGAGKVSPQGKAVVLDGRNGRIRERRRVRTGESFSYVAGAQSFHILRIPAK